MVRHPLVSRPAVAVERSKTENSSPAQQDFVVAEGLCPRVTVLRSHANLHRTVFDNHKDRRQSAH